MGLVKKAVREKVKIKVLLMSPSGAGKTYSALRLAQGMGGKTLLIDTEARRGLYYADKFNYDYVELKEVKRKDADFDDYKSLLPKINEPFAPENYIALIRYAVDEGYDNLIIDSLTHEWNAVGGILDAKNKMAEYKNDFQKWAILTPRHNDFIYEILHSPINVIATVRGKDEYVLEENENGKKTPKKIGLGAVQRDGMEFEYTATFMIDQETHIAIAQKDNTGLFDGSNRVLTEDDGAALVEWANSGESNTTEVKNYESRRNTQYADEKSKAQIDELATTKDAVIAACTQKGGSKNEALMVILKKYEPKNGNPNKIKDLDTLKKLLDEVNGLE